jgi:8-oxo-dGTP pyrophosphatase MutT (NUDIX family)
MRKYIDLLNEAMNEDSLIDTSATPPEYEDKDEQHYEARRKTGFFGAQAAGCILMAKTTGRIMIVLRSAAVDQPHTWGNCGGAFDAKEERPIEAAKREAHEETGYTGPIQMIPLYVFRKDTFAYSNFLAIVDDEFKPHLGWEADRAVWVDFGHWPTPLHFGLKALFGDAASVKVIKHYADMFRAGDHAVESVEEDIQLPAGVDVAKAIGDAHDAAKALADDDAVDANAPVAGQPAKPGQPAAQPAPGQPAAPAAPAKPGQPAPAPGAAAPAAPAPGAPAPGAPAPKKSLAPIQPQ